MQRDGLMTNKRINLSFPKIRKDELDNLARIYSVEEEKTLTMHDLIRRAIQEKYELTQNDKVQHIESLSVFYPIPYYLAFPSSGIMC